MLTVLQLWKGIFFSSRQDERAKMKIVHLRRKKNNFKAQRLYAH